MPLTRLGARKEQRALRGAVSALHTMSPQGALRGHVFVVATHLNAPGARSWDLRAMGATQGGGGGGYPEGWGKRRRPCEARSAAPDGAAAELVEAPALAPGEDTTGAPWQARRDSAAVTARARARALREPQRHARRVAPQQRRRGGREPRAYAREKGAPRYADGARARTSAGGQKRRRAAALRPPEARRARRRPPRAARCAGH